MSDGRYSVDSEKLAGGLEVYLLRDNQSGSEVRLAPAFGNNLFSFRAGLPGRSKSVEVMLGPAQVEELGQGFGFIFYGNPILFPYPNRVRNGRFSFEGAAHQLRVFPPSGHGIHGLVLDQPWKVTETSQGEGAAIVSAFDAADYSSVQTQFPFPFSLAVKYSLSGCLLKMESKVKNTGSGRMPMGFGIHPYFRIPLSDGGRRQDCLVRIPASAQWQLDADLLPTGSVVDVPPERDFRKLRALGDLALDDVYTRVALKEGWSECVLLDPVAGVQVKVRADAGFREIVAYAPPDRPAICFEPYTCTTDALNLQPRGVDAGLIVLEPGAEWGGVVEFEVATV